MEDLFCVVTADVIKSQREDWRPLKDRIEQIMDSVNTMYSEFLHVNFMFTLGDEFQGLLKSPEKSYDVVSLIQDELYPYKARFGVGIGGVSGDVGDVRKMAGTAFYNSRDALNRAKKEKKIVVYSSSSHPGDIETLNVILDLLNTLRDGWTETQQDHIRRYREYLKQDRVAKELGKSPSSVSQVLSKAHFDIVRSTEKYVRKLLSGISKN